MIRTTLASTIVLAALSVAFVAGRATVPSDGLVLAAQPEGMPSEEQIRDMMAMRSATAPEHEHLKHLAGEWDATMNFLTEPGGEPEVSECKARTKPVLDGRFMLTHFKGEFVFMGVASPFEGYGIMGYDKQKGEYVSVWMDSMTTAIQMQTGECNEDGTVITVSGVTEGMMGPTVMKNAYRFHDDGSYTLEFYQADPTTGEMMKIGWIDHTRP